MKNQFGNIQFICRAFLMIILYVNCSSAIHAQNNAIKITAFNQDNLNLSYERAINMKTSAAIRFKFYNRDYSDDQLFSKDKTTFTHQGFKLTGEYRVYLTSPEKKLNGLYVAPHASVGSHSLNYYREIKSEGLGLGGFVFGTLFDLLDGDLDASREITQTTTIIRGNAKVTSLGAGLKIGYQQRWGNFLLDFGTKLSGQSTRLKGIPLNNGSHQTLPTTVKGGLAEVYFGLGLAF